MPGAAATSVAQAAAPYWRTTGMTYLSYANNCTAMVHNCLKEPFKSKALQREHAYYKFQPYADGAPQKAVVQESGAPLQARWSCGCRWKLKSSFTRFVYSQSFVKECK